MKRLVWLLLAAPLFGAETGAFTIHMILHAIGEERYEIGPSDGGLTLKSTMEISDRGNKRTTSVEMRMGPDYAPHAPAMLDVKFRGMGSATTAEQMHARMANTLAVIGALHRAGVTIVPGSDTGLVGYGLLRELELYVEAGMTPLEAIQSATIVSARAMGLEKDTGSIERGKRADLILVDGDPLARISDLRKVSHVVTNGRMYAAAQLRQSVGFH